MPNTLPMNLRWSDDLIVVARPQADWEADTKVRDGNIMALVTDGANMGKHKLFNGQNIFNDLDYLEDNSGGGGGSAAWGDIGGTLSNQTDLQAALDAKAENTTELTNSSFVPGATATAALNNTRIIGITWADANDPMGSGGVTPAANQLVLIIHDGTDNPAIGRIYPAWHDGTKNISELVTEGLYLVPSAAIKRYVALVSQSGTDDPAVTVLENSLGAAVVWTRNGVGDYLATLAGAFPQGRTAIQQPPFDLFNNLNFIQVSGPQDDLFQVFTVDMSGFPVSQSLVDGVLNQTPFIVTVYPAP